MPLSKGPVINETVIPNVQNTVQSNDNNMLKTIGTVAGVGLAVGAAAYGVSEHIKNKTKDDDHYEYDKNKDKDYEYQE